MKALRENQIIEICATEQIMQGDLLFARNHGLLRFVDTVDERDDLFITQIGDNFRKIYSPSFKNRIINNVLVLDESPQTFDYSPDSLDYDNVKAFAEGRR